MIDSNSQSPHPFDASLVALATSRDGGLSELIECTGSRERERERERERKIPKKSRAQVNLVGIIFTVFQTV